MRRIVMILSAASILCLPALGLGNGPPLPAPLYYLRTPDKKGDDKTPAPKVVGVTENVPIMLTYRSDVVRPQMLVPKKFAVLAPAKAEADAPNGRTLFAGLTLSAAFVTGGLWLVRRGKGKAMLVLCAVSSSMFISPFLADVSSNGARPPKLSKPLDELKIDGTTATLGVDLVTVEEGEHIKLILPKRILPAAMIPPEEFEKKPAFLGMGLVPGLYDLKKKVEEKKKGNEE